MIDQNKQSGFTAVELLITLFVAAAFLVAGYQLFSVVVRDGGQTRAESRAANIAYDYLRRYSGAVSNPCSSQTLVDNESINVTGLSNVTVSVTATCLLSELSTVSKIQASITYNDPQKTVSYVTYVDSSSGSESVNTEVTDGLIGWWKFNGNPNSSIGSAHGTVYGATLTNGQNNSPNSAYSFNGTSSYITIPNMPGFPSSTVAISFWAYPRNTGADGTGVIGTTQNVTYNRISVFLPWANNVMWDFGSDTTRLSVAWNSSWQNQWSHWVFIASPAGRAIYRNGTLAASNASNASFNPENISFFLGRFEAGQFWNGNLDDVRIYDRILAPAEITSLYNRGAQ